MWVACLCCSVICCSPTLKSNPENSAAAEYPRQRSERQLLPMFTCYHHLVLGLSWTTCRSCLLLWSLLYSKQLIVRNSCNIVFVRCGPLTEIPEVCCGFWMRRWWHQAPVRAMSSRESASTTAMLVHTIHTHTHTNPSGSFRALLSVIPLSGPCSAPVWAAPAVRGEPSDGLWPSPLRPHRMVRSDSEQPVCSQCHLPSPELYHVSVSATVTHRQLEPPVGENI